MFFFWFFNIEQQQRKQGLGGLEEIEQFEINGLSTVQKIKEA